MDGKSDRPGLRSRFDRLPQATLVVPCQERVQADVVEVEAELGVDQGAAMSVAGLRRRRDRARRGEFPPRSPRAGTASEPRPCQRRVGSAARPRSRDDVGRPARERPTAVPGSAPSHRQPPGSRANRSRIPSSAPSRCCIFSGSAASRERMRFSSVASRASSWRMSSGLSASLDELTARWNASSASWERRRPRRDAIAANERPSLRSARTSWSL